MKRVLVTGAGGQLAIELERWAPEGCEVVSLGADRLDITSAAQVDSAFAAVRPEVVFNAAAFTAVDLAETEERAADRVNHRGVELLRSACDGHGARLVQVSTDYVFDGLSARPYLPGDETNPLSAYGRTKRDGEIAALRSPGSLVVRTAWLYGANGRNFMRTMIRLMQERDEVRVVADQVGTPTSAPGLARALWALAGRGATGMHHWTDAGVASWYDFAVAIREEAAAIGLGTDRARVTPIRTSDYPTAARRPAMGVLSKDATWAVLGGPAAHWRDGLREVLSEFMATSHANAVGTPTKGAR
ncbi:MAG: dTDP-4-dehydrorhamnose reductase [Planctomycetota bacterium]